MVQVTAREAVGANFVRRIKDQPTFLSHTWKSSKGRIKSLPIVVREFLEAARPFLEWPGMVVDGEVVLITIRIAFHLYLMLRALLRALTKLTVLSMLGQRLLSRASGSKMIR